MIDGGRLSLDAQRRVSPLNHAFKKIERGEASAVGMNSEKRTAVTQF